MKNLLFPIFFLALVLSQSACHKYPKDIPDWLKKKIRVLDRETRDKGCRNDLCMVIREYSLNGQIFYFFNDGSDTAEGIIYTIYDYDGNVVCNYYQPLIPGATCPIYASAEYIRTIWTERH